MFAGRTPSITLPDFFVASRHFCCGGMTDAQSTTQRGAAKLQKWVQGLQWGAGVARGTHEQHMGLFVDTSQPEPSETSRLHPMYWAMLLSQYFAYIRFVSFPGEHQNTLKKERKRVKSDKWAKHTGIADVSKPTS
jgi:hypothetical protein